MKKFNELPVEIQEEVKGTLRAYDTCNVTFENGRYDVSPHSFLSAKRAADYEFLGTYKVDEVFTESERICNYVSTFRDFPPFYKGERDYEMLNRMREARKIHQMGEWGNMHITHIEEPLPKLDEKGNLYFDGAARVFYFDEKGNTVRTEVKGA